MNNFIKFLFAVLCCAATVAAAQTNSPYRQVDGVIYNPKFSKLWVQIPIEKDEAGWVGANTLVSSTVHEEYTVSSVRTNGVIFSVVKKTWSSTSDVNREQADGYVFVKNIPHRETFYTNQKLEEKFLALPIKNTDFPTKDGGKITVRAYDCGEPCNLPTKKP